VVLFETAEAVKTNDFKANQLPLIIIDDSEDKVSLSAVPLWLAFAPDPQMSKNYDFDSHSLPTPLSCDFFG